VLLGVLLCGCSSSRADTHASAPADRERQGTSSPKGDAAWLILLAEWRMDLARRAERALEVARDVQDGKTEKADLERVLHRLAECPDILRDEVGEPRAPRFTKSYSLFIKACDGIRSWALTVEEASGGDESIPTKDVKAQDKEVADLFEDADTNLDSVLLARKPLPDIAKNVSRSRIEPRLGRAISELAYRSPDAAGTEVRCWSKRDWTAVKTEWAAFAGGSGDAVAFTYDLYRVSIAPEYCAPLARFIYEHRRPTQGRELLDTAASVGVLAHETGHLYEALLNEARTECFAVQHVRRLARILGASPSYAALLAETNWKYVHPLLPKGYRTPDCRNGGSLDENPRSDVWP
jgi:hypothetical protein